MTNSRVGLMGRRGSLQNPEITRFFGQGRRHSTGQALTYRWASTNTETPLFVKVAYSNSNFNQTTLPKNKWLSLWRSRLCHSVINLNTKTHTPACASQVCPESTNLANTELEKANLVDLIYNLLSAESFILCFCGFPDNVEMHCSFSGAAMLYCNTVHNYIVS